MCIWLLVSGIALIGIVLNRLMLAAMINTVVHMLGVCAESLLAATLTPVHEDDGGYMSASTILISFFPLVVDGLANIALIVYCCWLTKSGMSFDPQEYQLEEEIRHRKHKASMSSTFRRFDVVDDGSQ